MESQPVPSILAPFLRRVLSALCGATALAFVATAVVAFHDVVRFGVPFVPAVGLVFPFAAGVALFVGFSLAFLQPQTFFFSLQARLSTQRARVAFLLTGIALFLTWWLVGQISVGLLTAFSDRPRLGGLIVSAAALGIVLLMVGGAQRLAGAVASRIPELKTRTAIALGLIIPVVLAVVLVLSGTTSGVGAPWALFGVFRRDELDLAPVFHLALVLGCTYVGAYMSKRGALAIWLAGSVLALFIGVFALSTASRIDARSVVSIERSRGLAAFVLAGARKLDDADGDGYSSRFGGGDCDDTNALVHPGAIDIPGNGIDEDCRGGDKLLAPEAAPDRAEAGSDAQKSVAYKLPDSANVLLLTIDTMRWDLGFMSEGARKGLSPRLDQLAARSTVFEYAYSLASYTSKSLGPMMVGRYPSETKRTFEHFDRFSKDVPMLQERMQAAGIYTTSVQGYWYFFFKGYGFERGWDVLDSTSAPKAVLIEGDKSSNGDKLADRTIEHLGAMRDSGKRFFMWTHWVDPHAEYVPHEGFDFGPSPRERYDGEIAFVDHQVGRILDALENLQLSKNTIIIVTSDHGEAFGEHGMIRHGFEVWDVLARVPLVVHVPGVPPRRVKERRSIIDVAPTLLEALDVQVTQSDADFIRGTSLLRDVLAPPDAQLAERPVLVDMAEGPNNKERRAFYLGDLKLITTNGRVLGLYDVKNDPDELKDLSDQKEKVSQMESAMNSYLDTLREVPATR